MTKQQGKIIKELREQVRYLKKDKYKCPLCDSYTAKGNFRFHLSQTHNIRRKD